MRFQILKTLLAVSSAALILGSAIAAQEPYAPNRIPDVSNTKHNFALGATPQLPTGDSRTVFASAATTGKGESEVCVFCHTPHYAGIDGQTDTFLPLWNRALATHTYTDAPDQLYSSGTLEIDLTEAANQPGTSSKMCLSCHDGTLAIGSVLAINGSSNATKDGAGIVTGITETTITMTGVSGDGSLAETDVNTGFTSNLGTDLDNDHPIGFTYDSTTDDNDGELVDPASSLHIATRVGRKTAGGGATSSRMPVPLEAGKMECTTCHDPHLRGTGTAEDRNIKFLRLNRFQQVQSVDGSFSVSNDIGCLACHEKKGWAGSAHANPATATAQYDSSAATLRDFPQNLQVWEAGCLNCHDTHTVKGADYLLREGTDDTNLPKVGGNAAQEEACFQCHGSSAKSALQTPLPDLENLMSATTPHDVVSAEIHTIQKTATSIDGVASVNSDGDHVETQALIDNGNRHVECADCHHPHRARTSKVFDSTHTDITAVVGQAAPNWAGVDFSGQGTHVHEANTLHTNIASGALRGTWGVEPLTWVGAAWNDDVATWQVLQDDPSEIAATNIVTKEYQVCLKCHSGFANLAGATSQSMEFQAPAADKGENTAGTTHRSWHPVMDSTGRDITERPALSANTFVDPFDTAVGSQTMYCSDCHGSDSSFDGEGPHGSTHNKVLKAAYSDGSGATPATGRAGTESHLCFSCHKWDQYANSATPVALLENSGFSCAAAGDCWQNDGTTGTNAGASNSLYTANLHIAHAVKDTNFACTRCHMMQPHGSGDKALLVDASAIDANYESADATFGAKLQVDNWKFSGNWSRTLSTNDDCTSSGCHTYP